MSRQVNDATLSLTKRSETLRLKAYLDPVGIPTIGYGHTAGVTLADVQAGRTITEAMADQLLRSDMGSAESAVERLVTASLTDGQFGALVDFAFNCGNTAFSKSTLLRLVNAGQFAAVPGELKKWHFGGGASLPGLVTRRGVEALLWTGATVGVPESAPALVDDAALAAVFLINNRTVDVMRAQTGGLLPVTVAVLAHQNATTAIVEAVGPYLDGGTDAVARLIAPLIDDAIVRAVARLKLPDATLDLFPA